MTFLFSPDVKPPVLEPDAVRREYGQQIEAALTRQLYRGSGLPTLLMLLSGLSCVSLLWSHAHHALLGTLLGWLTLLALLRLWQTAAFQRASAGEQAAPAWRHTFLLGVAASGMTLAVIGVLLMPLAEPRQQALVYGLLAAAIISASVSYAASPRTFLAFALPGLLPSSLYLLRHADPQLQGWGVFGLILLPTLLLSAWQINRNWQHHLVQRFQKQALLEFQEQARRASVQMNLELASEVRQRQRVEAQLRAAQRALEERVSERTRALTASELARRKEEAERLYLTNHDALTGLANRSLLLQRLEALAACPPRPGQELALLHLDLDRFKRLNDSLGLAAADGILREMARRIEGCLHQAELIARIAVDEFAILLEVREGDDGLEPLARHLLALLREGIVVGEQELVISASLGIALLSGAAGDPATLLNQASIAMRHAKQLGGNSVQFYRDSLQGGSRERLLLEAQLDKALVRGQLEVFYQPRLSLGVERLLSAEALVRWRHPDYGLVTPGGFIALAEETGQINAIGDFVLRRACAEARAWQRDGLAELRVSVNISMQQLRQSDFVARIAAVLEETGLPAPLLELELTETQLSDNVEDVAAQFRQLRALGVRLAIDDFGTGYSSLGYLKHLPVDVVKIDQTFIRELDGSEECGDAAITRAIIAMAHSLGLEVVAEGVEQPAQLDFLRRHGCDEIQGYLISRPLEAAAFAALLSAQGHAVGVPA
ncbi:putative bifunctional diguanylate cyclase/phosphodiesterase [Pseudomonas oryzae]|uniref:Diguanylate cyclase (GGDEF) domain-containing protein n=1 Tax=Pseudomonas oryzae TaxID=1392877 RepID=A0A1H1XYB1_9PSED|nr:EAL domain-containing protein [Pseudomonas oryzae]SDT14182.1 diguanylate cyclase (GGDEF) domain-containing protein [Pseudomonas oryzae]